MKAISIGLILFASLNIYGASAKKFSVMTYNVENLFDTTHDAGKSDWTYLPLAVKKTSSEVQKYCKTKSSYRRKECFELNWSQEVLQRKIQNISKVIKAFNDGRGADVLVFQEVENINVLTYLKENALNNLGYNHIELIEGPDKRGIDIGIISRLPIISTHYHPVNLLPHSSRSTRGILEARVIFQNKLISILGNHWPSQLNRDETRVRAAQTLKSVALKSKSDIFIAVGDFNTTDRDYPHGINEHILPIFEDVQEEVFKEIGRSFNGTHYYRGKWSSLDKVYLLRNSYKKATMEIDHESFRIISHEEFTKSGGVPLRFNSKSFEGASDHLPVAVSFSIWN